MKVVMKVINEYKKGFTLIELLTVISIIIILSGIIIPTINIARTRAFEAKTKAGISSLELALSMYEADIGNFPVQIATGYFDKKWLTEAATNSSSWNGPYIEFKSDEVSGSYVVDSWGERLQYKTNLDGTSFDLWSLGKNGIDNNRKGDDIFN